MRYLFKALCCVLLTAFSISGCKKEVTHAVNTGTLSGKDIFVSVTSAGNYSTADLQVYAGEKGLTAFSPLIKYNVDFYKLIYKTTYNGKLITASGLLCIPQGMLSAPAILSAQHVTITRDSDAPSYFPGSSTGFEFFASSGFVTVIPDYIGYGASNTIYPPYYDRSYSGEAVADMINAAKYYLSTQKIVINNKLFLLGYSEGGYVTMAAQQAIETNPDYNLTVTAAAEGAGGYDLNGMLSEIDTAVSYPDPSFLALFLTSYNTTYQWNRPLTDFFNQPYASAIPSLLNGTHTITQINQGLNTNVRSVLNPTFYFNLDNPGGESTLKAQLAANSFPAWFPTSPTRLYHGTADEDVFFQTSQTTYNRFIAAGSTQLTFIPIPGGTHETSAGPMLMDAFSWIETLDH